MKTSLRDVYNKEPEYTKEEFKRMESKKRKAPNISSSPSTVILENLHMRRVYYFIGDFVTRRLRLL